MTTPGWYPDPDDPDARRYYDGNGWSAPVRTDELSSMAPRPSDAHRATWPLPLLSVAALVGAILLGVGLFLGYGDVHRDGVNCGSPFGGSSQDAEVSDLTNAMTGFGSTSAEDGCSDGLASRDTTAKALAWPGGVLLLIGGMGALAIVVDRSKAGAHATDTSATSATVGEPPTLYGHKD